MKKRFTAVRLTSLIFIAPVLLISASCSPDSSPPQTASPQASPAASTVASSAVQSPCDVSKDMVGENVQVEGDITFIESSDPEGVFADLEKGGCRVGVWVNRPQWDSWGAEEQSAFAVGSSVTVSGQLRSFGGNLIVELSSPPVLSSASQPDGSKTQQVAAPAFAPAPESYQLDVPLIYSGVEGSPSICYMGAFSMLAKYHNPELELSDVIACSGIGSNAIFLENPGMDPFLANGLWDAGIIHAAPLLGFEYVLGYEEGGWDSDFNSPSGMRFTDYAAGVKEFSGREEAFDYLRSAVASGHPVEVYLNIYYIYDDFAEVSDFWKTLGKDNASHYMTVTGYDGDYVYFNDPTDPTDAAANLPATIDSFLSAWERTDELSDAPLGPYWMIYLSDSGSMASADEIIRANVELAEGAPDEIRNFAPKANASYFTRFMLGELARGRLEYAAFLAGNNRNQAAGLYKECGNLYREMAVEGDVNAEALNEIADMEEQALGLLNQ